MERNRSSQATYVFETGVSCDFETVFSNSCVFEICAVLLTSVSILPCRRHPLLHYRNLGLPSKSVDGRMTASPASTAEVVVVRVIKVLQDVFRGFGQL